MLGEAAQWGCGTWERGGPLLTHPVPHHPQVLVLEMNKVLLPARLEIQGTDPVSAVTLSLLEPETQVKPLLRPPTHRCAPLLWNLSPFPRPLSQSPSIPLRATFFCQDVPSSWTFPVASICGVR